MKTIIGAFDDAAHAEKAAQALVNAGIGRNDISIIANNEGGRFAKVNDNSTTVTNASGDVVGHDAIVGAEWGAGLGFLIGLTGFAIPGLGWIAGAGWLMGTVLGAGTGAVVGGLVGVLASVGVPEEDASHYNEAVRRGSTLLAVRAEDAQAQSVATILNNNGAIDIDERAAQYRQQGYTPAVSTASTTAPVAAAQTNFMDTQSNLNTSSSINTDGETVLPVIEEELAVGKREVQRGGVRVYSHVTERPVQESVNLREEHVTVERRSVNQPVDANMITNLPEGVIEVRETAEVPVISKEARIVEEVVVSKEHTSRTETVSDTVRRTDVEVEQLPDSTVTTGSTVTTPR